MSDKIQGEGINPTYVANSILYRSFHDHIPVSPMKLQKLLFFTACIYERKSGRRLLSENFQTWKYGPVSPNVYDEFRGFGGQTIDRYAQDALSRAYMADEKDDPVLAESLQLIWKNMAGMNAVQLSRVTHRINSAWYKAYQRGDVFISDEDMASDRTFDDLLVE